MSTAVLVTGKLHSTAIQALEAAPDIALTYMPDCPRTELYKQLERAEVLVTRSETAVDRELLNHAPQLKAVARAAVGVGNIDLAAATDKGVLVFNTPGKNTNSAAEMTMALLLAMLRHLPEAQKTLKTGGWDRHRFTGSELQGRTIGLLGLGHVGHRVAQFCRGFDMEVLAYDPYIAPERFQRYGVVQVRELETLLSQVDILSLHVPLNKDTRGLIAKQQLQQLKQGAFLINAARGGVIHEQDLLEVLEQDHLGGVAIDTFENEPQPMAELIKHPKVWCTPHIGASTYEAQQRIGQTVVQQLQKFINGGVVDYPVNLPEVGVIDQPGLKTYVVLAERLGMIAGQMLDFNPARIELVYRGHLAAMDTSILRLSWSKGFLSQKVDGFVSYVNVQSHLERMGIEAIEAEDPGFTSFKSALKINIYGAQAHEVLRIGGVVFDDRYMRLSLINEFYFEVEPTGTMLLLENDDRPGVIGHLGTVLAEAAVNISSFALSRNSEGGRAMAIVCVDSPLSSEVMQGVLAIDNVISCHQIEL